MISVPKLDFSSAPSVLDNPLTQRVINLLTSGAMKRARSVSFAARATSDRVALDVLRAMLVRQLGETAADDPGASLWLAEAIVSLPPDEPRLLSRYARAARKAGDNERFEQALAQLAKTFPDDPGLAAFVASFEAEFAQHDAIPAAKLERAGLRLAAAGALYPRHYLPLLGCLRDRQAPPVRFEKLRALYPLMAEDTEVIRFFEAWQAEAIHQPPRIAVRMLLCILTFLPAEAVALDVLKATLDSRRVPDRALISALPDLRASITQAMMSQAGDFWRRKMKEHNETGEYDISVAYFNGLEALGLTGIADLEIAITSLNESEDRHSQLPYLISCLVDIGDKGGLLNRYAKEWQQQFDRSQRNRKLAIVWSAGARLLAARAASLEVLDGMLLAAGTFSPPAGELLALAERFDALDIPAPSTPLAGAINRLAAAVAARLAAKEVARPLRCLCWIGHYHSLPARTLEQIAIALESVSQDSVDETLAVLEPVRPGFVAYLRALRALTRQDYGSAAVFFGTAIEHGITGQLLEVARRELAANQFHPITEHQYPDEDAIVLVESLASKSLVTQALKLAPSVKISGASSVDIDTDAGEGIISGEIEFRFVDLPEVSGAAEFLSQWGIDAMSRSAKAAGIRLPLPRRQWENLRRHLFQRLFARLRVGYNFFQAVSSSGCRRAFFVVNQGDPARMAVRSLLAIGGFEIRIACGAPTTPVRRRFQPQAVAAGILPPMISAGNLAGDTLKRRKLKSLPQLRASPKIEGDAARPVILMVISSSRRDVIAPLSDLVPSLLDRWQPVVLFLDTSDTADFLQERISREISPVSIPFFRVDVKALWAEARAQFDATQLQQVLGAVDRTSSSISYGGFLLDADTVDVFNGIEKASAVAAEVDRWIVSSIEQIAPVAAIFSHSVMLEPNVICTALGDAGVPTFWLQMLQHPVDKRFKRPPATHHMVLDRYSKNLWRDFLGVPSEDITVVGSLRLSATLTQVRNLSYEDARLALSVTSEEKLILIATQTVAVQENLALIESVQRAIVDVTNARIMVKLHPAEAKERIGVYQRALDHPQRFGRDIVTDSHDVYHAIVASDLVVVQHSNIGIEAMLLDRCVIAVIVGERIGSFSLGEHGLEEVTAGPEAEARIRMLLTDPDARADADLARRKVLEENVELHDGRVAERITKAIETVLERRGRAS